MPTVCCLSYHYPPFGGVAVQRVLRFTRYLPEQGWRCLVVCAQPPKAASVPLDPALLQEVPAGLLVERHQTLEPECFHNTWKVPWDKIRRNFLKMFAAHFIPDDQAAWIEVGAKAAAALAREQKADLIWATGPPFSTLVAGARASQRSGLPLVVDFRDDWTGLRRARGLFDEARLAKEETLEREVFHQAARVVTVTPTLVEDLGRRSPHPERVVLLPNGFDPVHFQDSVPVEPGLVFTAGSLYRERAPEGFFEAWERFRSLHPQSSLHLQLAGPVAEDCRHYFPAGRQDLRWLGFLSHQEVRRKLLQAQVNLAWIDPHLSQQAFSGKLLEYLGAGRPVLMLGELDTPAARLLEEAGLGKTVRHDDAPAIAEALEKADRGLWTCQPQKDFIGQFDIRSQVQQLVQIFNDARA